MCLVFKKWTAPQIATEDIKVYKFLRVVNKFYNIYEAPIYPYCYGSLQDVLNTTFRQELPPLRATEFSFYTSKGLYSYSEVKGVSTYDIIWFECVIPKGALYYIDATQEYCSNELKFVKKLAK